MTAVDPSYPLRPIACIIAMAMLLLVFTNGFVRRSWNLGVTFLCFWLFIDNFTIGVGAIIWSDNVDIKLYVYCDIVSRLGLVTYIVKPMPTLLITRRLNMIANFQSVYLPSEVKRRWNLVFEWTLGLLLPLMVAGPVYYVHQGFRFGVYEGFGCTDGTQISILELLTIGLWSVLPPFISITFYYPRVFLAFYRQRRDFSAFLASNGSISTAHYRRILILASIDILITMPLAIVGNALAINSWTSNFSLPFYWGWKSLHADRNPVSYSYADLQDYGPTTLAYYYFSYWTSPVLAFAVFGLFGLTSEARASYSRVISTWLRRHPNAHMDSESLGNIEFHLRSEDYASSDDNAMRSGSRRA